MCKVEASKLCQRKINRRKKRWQKYGYGNSGGIEFIQLVLKMRLYALENEDAKLHSRGWFGRSGKDGLLYGTCMKKQGIPAYELVG